MHRSKGSFKAQAIRKYQDNLKKIKKRKVASIWDIINDPDLHFFQKVDYIRHHFVYYDGNYELLIRYFKTLFSMRLTKSSESGAFSNWCPVTFS